MSTKCYTITFTGAASPTLRAAFDDCQVTTDHGVTTLRTPDVDRAALHGLLNRIDSLGLEVLEVKLIHEAARST